MNEPELKILRDRARTLARQTAPPQPGATLEIVEFRLANERYALERAFVREVCPLRDLTPLPGTPPAVAGIVNVRGRIVPVIQIKKLFGLPESGPNESHVVVIAHHQDMEIGILADSLAGARSIPLSSLSPSLPTLTGIRADYLRGVTDESIVVLDARRILAEEKILLDESAAA